LATNIGYVHNSTAGLVSGYYWANAPTVSTYTSTDSWYTNNPKGSFAKSDECILVAFNPASTNSLPTYIPSTNTPSTNSSPAISTPTNSTLEAARAYELVYLTGASPSDQPDALQIGHSYGSNVTMAITTSNTGCAIVGMTTADGTPTNATGSALNCSTTSMTMIGDLDTNIGYALNSSPGTVSAYFFTNAPNIGTYSRIDAWTTNGPIPGSVAKSEETIMVAFDPASGPGGQASYGGFLQGNYYASDDNAVDVLTLSNAVPAQATLIVFETYHGSTNLTSGTVTNSSNYVAVLQGTQLLENSWQTIYSMYCSNGLAAGANIGMGYNQPGSGPPTNSTPAAPTDLRIITSQ
jgi:hypothetical protein